MNTWSRSFLATLLSVLAVLPVPGGVLAAGETIVIKGSDTIGGEAMPAIAEAYRRKNPSVGLEVGALGSATAFVGLFDGSADIGESSRPINEKESAAAKELGLRLQELVIGYDGVAVIVHPDNPVKELTVAQLSALFTGNVRNWKKLGGKDLPVRLISRPSYSGTHSFFKEKAVRRGNAKGPEEFSPETEFLEDNVQILQAVASDPKAVSYVGLGWLRATVKAVAVAGPAGAGVVPSSESVRTGRYPLYRPLLMYVSSTVKPAAADFIRFVLSQEGAAVMTRSGFVPPDASTPIPPFIAAAASRMGSTASSASATSATSATSAAAPAAAPAAAGPGAAVPAAPAAAASPASAPNRKFEVVRIVFPFGSMKVGEEGAKNIETAAARLNAGGVSAKITGHADSVGKADTNRRVALARAHAVANALLAKGVKPALLVVDAEGAEAPVASNRSTEGRAQNRRVDIELIAK